MRFYKFTNKEEVHNGFKYKTGLNVDTQPFNPSGDCKPGGLYFAREDIFAFVKYDGWLREVTLPENEPVYENTREPKKFKAHRIILGEREKVTVEVIERLIKEGANAKVCGSCALRWAAYDGCIKIVKLLIPYSDVEAYNSQALRFAAKNGRIELVNLFIPLSDVKACDSEALRWAKENKHTEIVKLLEEALKGEKS